MGKQVKRTRRSTTEKVVGDIGQCRWVLRQTKIRQARVSQQITCKTNPTKDLAKKRRRQPLSVPSEVRSEKSCVGESSISVVKAVYVKNLPKNITQDRLKELFEHHGKITKVVLRSAKLEHENIEKSRFGFVHFMERSSAMKALKNTEKYEIDGQVLECSLAKPPADQKSQQPALLPTYPPADQKLQQPALLPTYPPADQKLPQPALLPTYPPADQRLQQPALLPTYPPADQRLQQPALLPTYPPADQRLQQPALLPTYPPWLGYGLVGGAYGALGAGYGGAGFGQPMMYGPTPMMYGPTPGMAMMPMLLPDGRIGYVLQQPGAQGPAPPPVLPAPPPQQSSRQQPGAQGPAPPPVLPAPPPQQSSSSSSSTGGSSTGGSSSGGRLSSVSRPGG